jgi:hypothetical protein
MMRLELVSDEECTRRSEIGGFETNVLSVHRTLETALALNSLSPFSKLFERAKTKGTLFSRSWRESSRESEYRSATTFLFTCHTVDAKMDEPITKRLHVSGLTPNLSPADLSARLSNFGTVTSLDGFGLLDAVGQPRRFGYVTLETTQASLKRCES